MKAVEVVPVVPPPEDQRVSRGATFAAPNERKTRYSLPNALESTSPIGYRTRVSLTREEAAEALSLLSLPRPTAFAAPTPTTDQVLFEEATLGILTARQSTNFRGHRQVTVGPEDSAAVADVLRTLTGLDAPVLDGASRTHIVLCRPYRTAFTLLLTFIGHQPWKSLMSVPKRALDKRLRHADDIPTIGYLTQLHVGILADHMDRAAIVATEGAQRANVLMKPFSGRYLTENQTVVEPLYALAGVTGRERRQGWRIAFVAQVGNAIKSERAALRPKTARKLGANLVAFRSERIQPGVNAEDRAPQPYRQRQDMDVPERLVEMCGRGGYNAFAHWTGTDREAVKDVLLLERVDVLSPGGKERLREIRTELSDITDRVVATLPKWADLPLGRALSRNANRGRKAFALAGQRVYIGGLARKQVDALGLDWDHAVRALGAACARSGLVVEIMGATEIPEGCDLLAGVCIMAGPVNQNDVGKQFFGYKDLLAGAWPDRDPTSLIVWTLKAKTVADPIGNEEQLLNAARKGALVDLRPGPHEVCSVRVDAAVVPFRKQGSATSRERAFADADNFVTDPSGAHIRGNLGEAWADRDAVLWSNR